MFMWTLVFRAWARLRTGRSANPEGVPISNRQACNRGCDEELDNRRDLSAIDGEIGIGCIGKIVVPCHLLIAVEAGH